MDRISPAEAELRLRDFGYPDEVVTVLLRVRNALERPGLVSLLLVGSGGRGELRYAVGEGGFRIDSDLELFALVARGFPRDESLAQVKEVETEIARTSPGFHIDIAFLDAGVRRLPRNLDLVEARKESVLLTGRDFRDSLPEEPDPRQVVEGTLWQLWELVQVMDLHALPGGLQARQVKSALGRCSLHLLTLILVLEKVNLPRLSDKVRFFGDNYGALRASAFFEPGYRTFFSDALAERLGGEMSRSPVEVYRRLLQGYERGVAFSCEVLRIPMADPFPPPGILPPVRLRRALYEAWVAARHGRAWGISRSLAWSLRRGRGAVKAGYLSALNRLVLAEAVGDAATAACSRESLRLLAGEIWPAADPAALTCADDFKSIFLNYLTGAFPWYARRYNQTPSV
jgi:hypothetical protein